MALLVKNLTASAGVISNAGSIPGSGKFSGKGNDNPLQYSCLENSIDRGAWQATVHRVAKSQTHILVIKQKSWDLCEDKVDRIS